MENTFKILEIRENSILVDTISGKTAIAKYEDKKGIYFFNGDLEKEYVFINDYISKLWDLRWNFAYNAQSSLKPEIVENNFSEMRKIDQAIEALKQYNNL